MQLLNYVATVKDYSNFILIDEEKNIDIEVRCDSKKQIIEDYKICGLNNYFGMADSNIAIKNYKKIDNTELNIQSPVITNIMNNNWQFNGLNIGTEESSIDGYRIFFDEGYDVKVIETDNMQPKVFNIVFNTRYTSNVVNGLNTKSTIEDVRSKLGKPTFDKEEAGVIGYKSNKIYAFFAKTQNGLEISIYNVENVDTSKFSEAVSEFLTEKKYNLFIDNVLNIWEDADVYEMQDDYVLLQYSTKGIKIEFNTSNPSGITICSNFKGNITKDIKIDDVLSLTKELPDNIYFSDKDLVLETELLRISNHIIDENLNYGNKIFYVIPINYGIEDGNKSLNFYSIDEKYPDFQIYEYINDYLWTDDTHFIYSVKQKGIYVVNVVTRKVDNIVLGSGTYDLKEFKNGVLSYDDTSIKVNF